jgi:hypothetical protein
LIRADLIVIDLGRHRDYADTLRVAGANGLLSAGFLTASPAGLSA